MEEIIIKEKEVREKIINIINSSELPAFILKPIIKDLYEQLNNIEEQQYQQAIQSKINKEKKEKEDKKK